MKREIKQLFAERLDENRIMHYSFKMLHEILKRMKPDLEMVDIWAISDGDVALVRYNFDGNAYEISIKPIQSGQYKGLWGDKIKKREERKPPEVAEDLNPGDLEQFSGTENYYRHSSGYVYTDGVKHLATEGNAYWLIDKILITTKFKPKLQEFGVWKLVVNEDDSATLTCEDGNGHKLYTEKIDYTDFPLKEATLWFENGVLILPSEH